MQNVVKYYIYEIKPTKYGLLVFDWNKIADAALNTNQTISVNDLIDKCLKHRLIRAWQ